MIKRVRLTDDGWITWHCPGCGHGHGVPVGVNRWYWNGSQERPSIQPSVLVNVGKANPMVPLCHVFITNGFINFLPDCTHALAGQVVEMEDSEL